MTEKNKTDKMTNSSKPVPMKLFAAWEVDRTPSNCVPRLCTLRITRLRVCAGLGEAGAGAGSGAVILAARMHSSKRTLRSNDIAVQPPPYDVDLDLCFSLQYPHFVKRDGNRLQIMLQRRKKYKNRTILGYKTLAEGEVRMDQVLQRAMDTELELVRVGGKGAGGAGEGAVLARLAIAGLASTPVDHDAKTQSVQQAERGYSEEEEEGECSSLEEPDDAPYRRYRKQDLSYTKQRNLKQKFAALLRRFGAAAGEEQSAPRRSRLDRLFQELDALSAAPAPDPDQLDTISIGSTPKPSLRPFFASSRDLALYAESEAGDAYDDADAELDADADEDASDADDAERLSPASRGSSPNDYRESRRSLSTVELFAKLNSDPYLRRSAEEARGVALLAAGAAPALAGALRALALRVLSVRGEGVAAAVRALAATRTMPDLLVVAGPPESLAALLRAHGAGDPPAARRYAWLPAGAGAGAGAGAAGAGAAGAGPRALGPLPPAQWRRLLLGNSRRLLPVLERHLSGPASAACVGEAMVSAAADDAPIFIPFLCEVRVTSGEAETGAGGAGGGVGTGGPGGAAEGEGGDDALDLQVDYWLSSGSGAAGAGAERVAARALAAWRRGGCRDLTLDFTTREKKQKIMRLGKRRDKEEARRAEGVARLLAAAPAKRPVTLVIDGVVYRGVRLFQLTAATGRTLPLVLPPASASPPPVN